MKFGMEEFTDENGRKIRRPVLEDANVEWREDNEPVNIISDNIAWVMNTVERRDELEGENEKLREALYTLIASARPLAHAKDGWPAIDCLLAIWAAEQLLKEGE